MIKVEIIEVLDTVTGKVQEHAIIDRGNNEFTSMLKSTYDATLALELVDPELLEKPKK
jgi:hypothetical protein